VKFLCATRSGGLLVRLAVGMCLLSTLRGYAREEIKVYRVAKGPATSEAMLPEGWTATPLGEMRVASFSVKGKDGKQADVSVIPLPGGAGGDDANVNRWRGQVGLKSLAADELKNTAERVTVAGEAGELYDISGKNASTGDPTRILGVIQHRGDAAWFFKMTGDDQLVAQQKKAFVEFLKTFQSPAAGGGTALPPSHPPIDGNKLPPGHPEISATTGAPPPNREGQPKWQVPAGWKEANGGQFLVAKFLIAGKDNAQAAVNVSVSGGGLTANVNRWRVQQLGLPPTNEVELQSQMKSLEVDGGKASLVELTGMDPTSKQPAKLIGVILVRADGTWYYKLMGEPKLVEAQTDAFKTFVKNVKY